jgi:hypothetical protein
MRSFIFIASLFTFIIFSFWCYLWHYRVQFAQSAIERACPSQVTVGSVACPSLGTAVINDTRIIPQGSTEELHVKEVVLSSRLDHWFFFLLFPSTKPLFLDRLTLVIEPPSSPPSLSSGSTALKFETTFCIIHKGEEIIEKPFRGSISDLLKIAFEEELPQRMEEGSPLSVSN